MDLPLRIGKPITKTYHGNKVYTEGNVNTLARRLVTDIPGLQLNYATIMAEDALNIEQNFEITYSFSISIGTAKLSQFKIISAIIGKNKVNINWQILEASVTYIAQRDISVKRSKRRWLRRGRRRCSRQIHPRGITKTEIQRIHGTLTAVMNQIDSKSKAFGFKRVQNVAAESNKIVPASCPAWKPSINVHMDRSCFTAQQ